jgi:DNA-binding MarR family transcriptional regulator
VTAPSLTGAPASAELFGDDRQTALGWSAISAASRADEGARRVGLSLSQLRLLAAIAWGSANPSDLADMLDMKRPSVTRMADRLVDLGHIERVVDETDRRRINHLVTDRGREVLLEATRAIAISVLNVLEVLGPEAEVAEKGLLAWHRAASAHWWREDRRPGWPATTQQ